MEQRNFIGINGEYELTPCQIHNKFRKVYSKNLRGHYEIWETQIPLLYSWVYKYEIDNVKVEFYAKNHKLNRSATITLKGLEKDVENLREKLKGEFHLELN